MAGSRLSSLCVFLLLAVPAAAQIPNAGDQGRAAGLIMKVARSPEPQKLVAEQALFAIGGPALKHLHVARNRRDINITERTDRLIARIEASRGRTLGTTFARFDAGEFSMGSPTDEQRREESELSHDVRITQSFLIATREVTQDEYRRVMRAEPSWFARTGDGYRTMGAAFATGWFPVDSVTWFDAIEFCNRLSWLDEIKPYYRLTAIKRRGKSIVDAQVTVAGGTGYRLPTEAEWEFACRAGTKSPFHFADIAHGGNFQHSAPAGVYGQGWHNTKRTTTVANYKPNSAGLFDMHGNVAEWCWDWYDTEYYSSSPKSDPTGPASGSTRVLRGGWYHLQSHECRSASRSSHAPGEAKPWIGFRIARTATGRS